MLFFYVDLETILLISELYALVSCSINQLTSFFIYQTYQWIPKYPKRKLPYPVYASFSDYIVI